ncbi:hypothetical protein Tco_0978763 [Tanacetum coccineum]|uniref:Uncharacterized protein n=1 Tax=Tanacetum coccineum TaxID=301880 RepID=A0ABQ5ENV0_9ASTR
MDDPDIPMEEYVHLETEKALINGKVYNWEAATYGKIWYDEDVHYLRFFEAEFPAIVYNDALASKSDFSSKPMVSPQHTDKINLKNETSLSENDDEEYNVISYNDLFSFNIISVNDSKLDTENADNKIDIKQSSGDIPIKPLHNVISIDVTQGSNKLLETSHDTISKFSTMETFIGELYSNIVTWNYLNEGMLINLIKNLYVPFGISFDPKLFYKDGVKLQTTLT